MLINLLLNLIRYNYLNDHTISKNLLLIIIMRSLAKKTLSQNAYVFIWWDILKMCNNYVAESTR